MSIPLGLYQHFKGQFYRVMALAKHSETEELMVVYQALYGEKGVWVRPLSMFTEKVNREGETQSRFSFCEDQTEVLEVAMLDISPGMQSKFEAAFVQAEEIIMTMGGYITHELQRCIENGNRYALLVRWQSLEDHTEGFRGSVQYQQWRALLHHFYQPFPVVEHYQNL